MKANKEVSQYLTTQAEKVANDAWEIVDRCDKTDTYATSLEVNGLKLRAKLILSAAQNKTELKRLNKIFDFAIANLKTCLA